MIFTRPAIAADRPFILANWSNTLKWSDDVSLVPMDEFADTYRPFIEANLDRSNAIVAHGELGALMGFIVYDPTHYVAIVRGVRTTLEGYVLCVFTAGPFRRHYGVARRLFDAAGISPSQRFGYASRTFWTSKLRQKIPLAKYEPHRARFKETRHVQRTTATEAAESAHSGQEDLDARQRDHQHPARAEHTHDR